jgi:hypothetical protein
VRLAGLLLVLALLSACARDEPAATAPTPSRSAGPTQTASPAASPTATTDFGYFPAVVSAKAPIQLSFDRAQFLSGKEADKAAAEHHDETPVPNDYYIVNDNPLLRTVTLSASVRVTGSLGLNSYSGDGDRVEPAARTVEQLLGFLGTEQGKGTGFHLVYGAGGVVVSIEEQYQP